MHTHIPQMNAPAPAGILRPPLPAAAPAFFAKYGDVPAIIPVPVSPYLAARIDEMKGLKAVHPTSFTLDEGLAWEHFFESARQNG